MKKKTPTHAGCVVFRTDKRKRRYLIIRSSEDKHWVLPKGHIEKKDKSLQAAALRELKEEAGLKGEIIPHPIALQSYTKKDEEVVIQYFVARMTGKTKPKEERAVKWVNAEKAMEKLSFKEARKAFQEALEIMRSMS